VRAILVSIALLVLVSADASADELPRRSLHYGVGLGGFTAITGAADYGPVLEAEVYPGAGLGRWGIRGEVWGFEDSDSGRASLGVTFEGAAARPRLQLALHGDVGLSFPDHLPTVGGGVQSQLWIYGPIALGLDGGAVLIYDGLDSVLVIASSMTLRLGW
jgi:hypothetical protein